MSVEIAVAFALCFGAGPLLFRALTRARVTRARATALAVLIALLCGVALRAGRLVPQGFPVPAAAITLTGLWLAWVLALALLSQALQARFALAPLRRHILLAGMLATTLPWFGLAAARALSA